MSDFPDCALNDYLELIRLLRWGHFQNDGHSPRREPNIGETLSRARGF